MARRILVVEDEIVLMLLLVNEARARGYDATGTIDPYDVLERVRTTSPHVVLLDLHMPRMDGRDLLARIRAEPVPPQVIIVTGWIDDLTDELCRRYGAAAIVRKPFDPDDLFRKVAAATEAR